MARYTTLSGLKKAFDAGTLGGHTHLRIDTECAYVYVGPNDREVFCMNRRQLLNEALELLGIPAEKV